MKEIKIINHIEIDGQDHIWEDLPEDQRRELSRIIQDRMMLTIGFRNRKPA